VTTIAALNARVRRLDTHTARHERTLARIIEDATQAVSAGTATRHHFRILYPELRIQIAEALERVEEERRTHGRRTQRHHDLDDVVHAYLDCIEHPATDLPTTVVLNLRVPMNRHVGSSNPGWRDYVFANMLVVRLERWEAINEPRNGQNRTRTDIIDERP